MAQLHFSVESIPVAKNIQLCTLWDPGPERAVTYCTTAGLGPKQGLLTPSQGPYPAVTVAGMELLRMPGCGLPRCGKVGGKGLQTDVGMG